MWGKKTYVAFASCTVGLDARATGASRSMDILTSPLRMGKDWAVEGLLWWRARVAHANVSGALKYYFCPSLGVINLFLTHCAGVSWTGVADWLESWMSHVGGFNSPREHDQTFTFTPYLHHLDRLDTRQIQNACAKPNQQPINVTVSFQQRSVSQHLATATGPAF